MLHFFCYKRRISSNRIGLYLVRINSLIKRRIRKQGGISLSLSLSFPLSSSLLPTLFLYVFTLLIIECIFMEFILWIYHVRSSSDITDRYNKHHVCIYEVRTRIPKTSTRENQKIPLMKGKRKKNSLLLTHSTKREITF